MIASVPSLNNASGQSFSSPPAVQKGKQGSSRLLWGGHSLCQRESTAGFQDATQDTQSWRNLFMSLEHRNKFSTLDTGLQSNHTTADQLPWGWEQGEPNWMTVGHKQQDVAVFLYCHPNQSWKQEMKKCILCLVFDIEISLFLILSLRNLLWSAILVSQALGWKQWVLFPNTFSSSIETQLTCVMSSRKGH